MLTRISTYRSAEAEIDSSIAVLRGAAEEIASYNPPFIDKMAVFHSSNNILYSYILYGVVPSAYCSRICIRPSSQVSLPTLDIHRWIGERVSLPIEMHPVGQVEFRRSMKDADVVVFTGDYYNSLEVQAGFPSSLFLFFGSGINPFIVGSQADIGQAVQATVQSRLYNSGQDCMCPNVFFVHREVRSDFVAGLLDQVRQVKTGVSVDQDTVVNPLIYDEIPLLASLFLDKYRDRIIHGGQVDISRKLVEPTILLSAIDRMPEVEEHYCPIFNVVEYGCAQEVAEWIFSEERAESSFGACLFGEPELIEKLKPSHMLALNATLFDIENGNRPFGGYGMKASYVRYKDRAVSEPLLISEQVARFFHNSRSMTTAGYSSI
ncbi:aldehyde dehydrogenase family protein [Paenibacillus thiaminolyticus]|uniref:aldehyde dehydrogenase family protein n=1 Tax=Paenibacillus thiaminolyticus TaxID=49283 RepID=UPI0035A6E566